ncbi:MAG: hypothetical protein JST46_11145 [Bacteroidetes bacterium]|nr:hypothetical protein [Bacteroidota bacterium]
MIEKPTPGKATINNYLGGIEVKVPAPRNWAVIIFVSVWMLGWFFGEVIAASLFMEESESVTRIFLIVWLLLWTAGGALVFLVLAWMIAGQEIIKTDSGILEISKQVFSLRWTKRYQITEIRHLGINAVVTDSISGDLASRPAWRGGALKFDYGASTVRFALGLEEAEARILIEAFKKGRHFQAINFGDVAM